MSHPFPAPFVTGSWTVHPDLKTLSREGEEVRVGHKVMAVLVCLVEANGQLVTKDQLVERVWEGAYTTDEALATVVYELRKALGDDARQPRYVETIRKGGYRWLAKTSAVETTSVARTASPTFPPSALPPAGFSGQARRAGIAAVLLAAFAALAWLRPGAESAPQADLPIRSLAVLSLTPFEDQCSPNPWADQLTERLIAELQQGSLEVVPGLTIGLDGDRHALPAVWDADAVVEGAVVRSSDRLWVSVQLVDNRSGQTLWGNAYDRQLGDLDVLQRELSYEIAQQIERHTMPATAEPSPVEPTAESTTRVAETLDPRAAEAFDLASYFLRQDTALANQKAQQYFRQAIEHQPTYAAAHAGLAQSFLTSAETLPAAARQEALHQARQSAETALAMDSQQPVAHASLATISFRHAWDWRTAEDHFRRGRAGAQSSVELTPDYAFYLAALGRHAESIAAMRRLVEADPTSKQARWALGRVYYLARRFDEALVELAKARELDPDYLQAALLETEVLFATGQAEAAVEACEETLRLAGDSAEQVAALTTAYRQAGLDGLLRCLIAREVERSVEGLADPVLLATLEARRGAAEPALAWLSQAAASRHQDLVWLEVDPAFDSLRHTAEYRQLIDQLGLGA